jgi:N12 class adenine-specific DNA methylase
LKCQYLDEKTGGKGLVFATGTPISNTLSELFTIMRYLQADMLRKLRLEHFDSWASNTQKQKPQWSYLPKVAGVERKLGYLGTLICPN